MLCYRCGSYTPDGSEKCAVCGQEFTERQRTGKGVALAVSGAPSHVPPFKKDDLVDGRYRVADVIDRGSAGWTLRARDEEVDVDVGLKVIYANLLQTDADRTAFEKAVKRAQKVRHSNIVRIYNVGRAGQHVYYTMPHMEGLTLRKIIDLRINKAQVFSVDETLPLISQLVAACEGLGKFGHHGALRPSSVVVLPEVLKVTGLPHWQGLPHRPFLAAQQDARPYLAPEVRRDGEIDARADVYSLAVITAEMLSGEVPGADGGHWDEARSDLHGPLVKALQAGLAESPESRPATAAAFFEAVMDAAPEGDVEIDNAPIAQVMEEMATVPDLSFNLDDLDVIEDGQTTPVTPRIPFADGDQPVVSRERADDRPSRRPGAPPPPPSKSASGNRLGIMALLLAIAAIAAAWMVSDGDPMALIAKLQGSDEPPLEQAPPPPPKAEEVEAPTKLQDKKPSKRRRPRPASPKPRATKKPEPAPASKPAPKKPEPTGTSKDWWATPPAAPDPGNLKNALANAREEASGTVSAPAAPPKPPKREPRCPAGTVTIPAGSFQMGSSATDPQRGFGDLPAKRSTLNAYCVDIHEFPNTAGRKPLTNVSWHKARQKCASAGKRLCTEAEWERACKGPNGHRYPMGKGYAAGSCNIGDGKGTVATGAKSACRSGYGLFDMTGNAAEWTSSRWSGDVPDKVIKGGAYDQGDYTGRCSARANDGAGSKDATIGFRCCSEPR